MGEGKGLFIVRDDCPNVAPTLPALQRNPKNFDDVDPNSESQIYERLGYSRSAKRLICGGRSQNSPSVPGWRTNGTRYSRGVISDN
jgi:hypothetical protein